MNFGCETLTAFGVDCTSLERIADYGSTVLTPPAYWGTIIILFLAYTVAVLRSKTQSGLNIALLLAFPLIFFGRFPWWQFLELNPDEGFSGSAALALNRDPVYWRSIVGTTHGPLTHYILLIPSLFGLRIDFASLRFVGALLLASSSYITLAGLSRFVTRQAIVFGSLPGLLFLATAPFFDFQAYNGEQPLIFVLALAFYFLCRLAAQAPSCQLNSLIVIGGLVGIVPLVKLQGAPAGIVIGCSAFAFYAYQKSVRAILLAALLSACAAALPVCLAFLLAWKFDVFTELWNNAVLFNLFYVDRTHQSFLAKLTLALRTTLSTDSSRILIGNFTAVILCALTISAPFATKVVTRRTALLLVSMLVLAASWLSVALPGNDFTHYVMLLTVPSMAFGTIAFDCIEERSTGRATAQRLPLFVGAAIVCICGCAIYRQQEPTKQLFQKELKAKQSALFHMALLTIASVSDERDSLLVWGWSDWLHVRAGLPPATKYSGIFLNIQPSPLRTYFTSQYLSDFEAAQPAIVVEAIGPELFLDPENPLLNPEKREIGLNSVPKMSEIITRDYTNWGSDSSINIYVRRERIQLLRNIFAPDDVRAVLAQEAANSTNSEELREKLKKLLLDSPEKLTLDDISPPLSSRENKEGFSLKEMMYIRAKIFLQLRAQHDKKCLVNFTQCASQPVTKSTKQPAQ